jgi:hypothetical protein
MSSRIAALCVLALLSTAAGAEGLKLSGYYKNLLVSSETVSPAGQRYTLDLNRLRLELKGELAERIALDLQYDNEVLLGNYRRTGQFAIEKDRRPDQYWDLDGNYAEAGSWYGRQRLYRANVTLSSGDTDLRLGRQRIAWGTGRFWSPLDLLNPINPIALEREERLGVDAALAEHKLGPLSRISAVYAPRHESGESSAALSWHGNVEGIDYSLIGGRFRRERVAGADVATQWGGIGLRAELTHNRRETGPDYQRAVLAADYAFPNTLTLSGELYYNGAGAADRAAYDFASLFAGRIQNVGRRYFGGYLGYELTPLVKWTNYLVVNLADRSRFFSPGLSLSLQANLDLTLGVQLFSGSAGSEYSRLEDVYYAQLQGFF